MTKSRQSKATPDTTQVFEMDVRRSIILGAYIQHWDMPKYRRVATRKTDRIEVYSFPSNANAPVYRFATVGISGIKKKSDRINKELMLALPPDLGGATDDEVFKFMLDVSSYVVDELDMTEPPMITPETPLAPKEWRTRALLFDQARSEPEELSELVVGPDTIELLWVIPIYASEYELISNSGVEAFDALADQAELSPADINRDPWV
jgi:hypothetical protein